MTTDESKLPIAIKLASGLKLIDEIPVCCPSNLLIILWLLAKSYIIV